MTEPTPTAPVIDETPQTELPDAGHLPAAETDPAPAEPESPNAEAARYRHRAKEAEAARDTLAERLTGYERRDAERYADNLASPSDLWAAGVQLDDLRAEDGTIDENLVRAAVDAVLAERPHWAARRVPLPIPGAGARPGDRPTLSWSDVIRG
ncbi:hypothetical protein ICV35_26675 [Rhodococcus ruber]|nr:hypothetical protein [Rhodococcus ruber]